MRGLINAGLARADNTMEGPGPHKIDNMDYYVNILDVA
jgi:hypothetical protein